MTNKNNKILLVVQEFLKVHDRLEGKYWPMVEIFLQRLEKDIPEKKISKDFYKAYMETKQITAWEEIPNYWYQTVGRVRRVALKGREWIGEMQAKGLSFWIIVELAIEPDEKRKPKKKKSNVNNKFYRYFMEEHPIEFPILCAAFLEDKRLPDLGQEQKEWRFYERLSYKMLSILLLDPTYFFESFDPKNIHTLNWPSLCHKILQQIKPSQIPVILDAEIVVPHLEAEIPDEEEEEKEEEE